MKFRISMKIVKESLRPQVGDFSNSILYNLCRKYPLHKRDEVIMAKIWLIGRSYAAAIERRRIKTNINDDFYVDHVIPAFRRSKIDEKIASIKKYNDITENNALEILEVHKYILDLMYKITGLEKRSLASKYLHFHLPRLFFIYDSRADGALRKLIALKRGTFADIVSSPLVDKTYAMFFLASLSERAKLEKEINKNISTRQLDNILIGIANENLRK